MYQKLQKEISNLDVMLATLELEKATLELSRIKLKAKLENLEQSIISTVETTKSRL